MPGKLHEWQVAVHAPSQQTPSAQNPLAQSPLAAQRTPCCLAPPTHAPPAQYCGATHGAAALASDAPFGLAAQRPTWPGRLHARHAPVHATSQHTPSAQKPLPQSAATVQTAPVGFLSVAHAPARQYCIGPAHSVAALWSPCPVGTGEHVPGVAGRLHAWQVPAHALLQHTPSMQNPLLHWVAAVHASPLFLRASRQFP
jgi:hypothetical protein